MAKALRRAKSHKLLNQVQTQTSITMRTDEMSQLKYKCIHSLFCHRPELK